MPPSAPIAVRRYGAGPGLVVLLHGGPGAPGGMASLARDLGDRFRVLEPLQRGSGGEPLSVARHVADLAAVTPTETVLVGHSFGAMLALSFAAAHPDRVRGLVLVGCGTYDDASRAAYERAMEGRLGEHALARVAALREALATAPDAAARDRAFAELGRLMSRAQSVDPLGSPALDGADFRAFTEIWEDVLRLQREGVEPAAFAAVTAPVLMIHGSEDPHPGRDIHATLRRVLPRMEYAELDRCGHLPWLERHARRPFLDLLRYHLDALLAAPGRKRGR